MRQTFEGWPAVASRLQEEADRQQQLATEKGDSAAWLNGGQRDALRGIALRIVNNGVVIADEVGMGKTRIAVEVCRSVVKSGGRVALLVPPGLGYQWQDELRQASFPEVPEILRSLYGYLCEWESDGQLPWFDRPAVMISHAFTNWRFGENSQVWRWALVPEVYARWRELQDGRLPRNYHAYEILASGWVNEKVAQSIVAAVPNARNHPVRRFLDQMGEVQWPRPLDSSEYSKWGELRPWLERCVGFGLGVFDLVIVDEAHKSRGGESGLSRLLGNVVIGSAATRTLALTATPVELHVSQWKETLQRIGLSETTLAPILEVVNKYADAVQRVRRAWRSNEDARAAYKAAAMAFQSALNPYLLRRDKREDRFVQRFSEYSQLPLNAYRRELGITVNTSKLTRSWREAICAAESLSVVTRQADDPLAKRLRLTLGNGHGVAALLDQFKRSDEDIKQEQYDEIRSDNGAMDLTLNSAEKKRKERAEWWMSVLKPAFAAGSQALYEHPAILAATDAIEQATSAGEKVLVFGRFTRPLRALVDLLNAREMLRRVERDEPWPQTKVHGDPTAGAEQSEWEAVRSAHSQLGSLVELKTLDATLRSRYERESYRRERFRGHLIPAIEQGMAEVGPFGLAPKRIFEAFRRSVQSASGDSSADHRSVAILSRAITELLGSSFSDSSAIQTATAFSDLIMAVNDRDDADAETEIDEIRADELWKSIEDRLAEEYERPQGGFARLMYGGTSPASRRMIQLAFNRPRVFPNVLVAQSLVGREGLNLHKCCRTVILLHPEWNPGVVEQQIGRVDRVESHWCCKLSEAIQANAPVDQLPRIDVRPVIFRGTYDEHNWQVLRSRWDELRAQLHGIVVSSDDSSLDAEGKALIDELCAAAPNFSPSRRPD